MEIDRRLNLVYPIQTEAGTIYLHSTPISQEVWKNYFLVISKTYSQLFAQGLHTIAGPVVAALMLEQIAKQDGVWDGLQGVKSGLLAEIRRLTNVVMPGKTGWETTPYEVVMNAGTIDADTLAEAEGALIFFTCASAVLRGPKARPKLAILLGMTETMWDVQHTSSDCMAFAASLPTSTPAESSGVKTPGSSVPY